MDLVKALSLTPIGRALIAYFFDLPVWTLMNILFAVSLLPFVWSLLNGISAWWIGLLSFPVVVVSAGIVNMAAREVKEDTPRWRNLFTALPTYSVAFTIWAGLIIALTLLMSELPTVLFFIISALVLALLMICVFALFMPVLLNVRSRLAWHNALVFAVHYPIVALGLLALLVVGAWIVWISRGALVLLVPALWIVIAVFSVQDRIHDLQSTTQLD
jgi:hypothetical protein